MRGASSLLTCLHFHRSTDWLTAALKSIRQNESNESGASDESALESLDGRQSQMEMKLEQADKPLCCVLGRQCRIGSTPSERECELAGYMWEPCDNNWLRF